MSTPVVPVTAIDHRASIVNYIEKQAARHAKAARKATRAGRSERASDHRAMETEFLALASSIGAQLDIADPGISIRYADVENSACWVFGTNRKEINGHGRTPKIVMARCAITFICLRHLGMSCKMIGNMGGQRDHTTIMNRRDRANTMMAERGAFLGYVETIEKSLGLPVSG